jgi:hypothetical protein
MKLTAFVIAQTNRLQNSVGWLVLQNSTFARDVLGFPFGRSVKSTHRVDGQV